MSNQFSLQGKTVNGGTSVLEKCRNDLQSVRGKKKFFNSAGENFNEASLCHKDTVTISVSAFQNLQSLSHFCTLGHLYAQSL